MGYGNFKKISQVTKKSGLDARISDLFDNDINVKIPTDFLLKSLEMAYKSPLSTEKARSERLISPILMEIARSFQEDITLFSGEELNVNSDNDLMGVCDFSFDLHTQKIYLETPIILIAEAKGRELKWGIGQCAAQLYAAHLMNEQEGKTIDTLYGCATTGTEWLFLKFENKIFYIDRKSQTDLTQVLGTWHWIIQFFIDNYAKKYNP